MTRTLCIAMLMCLTAGCGTREEAGTTAGDAGVDLSNLPLTVEGMLVADVGEGDVDEDGDGGEYSEVNFGTLTVGGEEILVQVSGSVLKAANLPEAEGKVRATIGSKSSESGATYYEITDLERL
jgi:hypothetical protein